MVVPKAGLAWNDCNDMEVDDGNATGEMEDGGQQMVEEKRVASVPISFLLPLSVLLCRRRTQFPLGISLPLLLLGILIRAM